MEIFNLSKSLGFKIEDFKDNKIIGLSLLAKWLREVYNIHIEIIWNSNLTQKYNVQVHTLETRKKSI